MKNNIWIMPAVALALWSSPAFVAAQYVPPAPDQTSYTAPPEQPTFSTSEAPAARDAGWFAQGRSAVSLLVGSSFSGDRTYLILGADYGYYLVDGLELGAGATFYLFDEPFMMTLSPHIKYVLHMVKTVKPYIGAFYRHYIVSDFDDLDSLGARLGAYIAPGAARWYFGVGVAYEHILDCNDDYWSCDDVYPELVLAFGF